MSKGEMIQSKRSNKIKVKYLYLSIISYSKEVKFYFYVFTVRWTYLDLTMIRFYCCYYCLSFLCFQAGIVFCKIWGILEIISFVSCKHILLTSSASRPQLRFGQFPFASCPEPPLFASTSHLKEMYGKYNIVGIIKVNRHK